jgi:hypothetical protein
MIRSIRAICMAMAIAVPVTAAAQQSQSRLNYGVLLYSQQNYERAASVFVALGTPEANVWLARAYLQQENYRLAVETADQARKAGLSAELEQIARRVQIAAIRFGKLESEYAVLAAGLGIKTDRSWNLSFASDVASVSGLLKEFDINGNAVRDDDIRLSFTASGTYRLPYRPLDFQTVAGYRFTHRHFFENDGFNQQNHQPFVSLSRRVTADLSLSFRLDHTTSLSGAGLDLFVRQYGTGVSAVWRDKPLHLIRAGYSVTYSDFNNANGDDNVTNAIFVARSIQDADGPNNLTTFGMRLALVSADAQTSAHGLASLFVSRKVQVRDWATVTMRGAIGRARFNADDPVQNIRRTDTSLSAGIVAERDLDIGLTVSGQASINRVISTIDRIDRTSAVFSVGARKKF